MFSRKIVLAASFCAVTAALNLSVMLPADAASQNVTRKPEVLKARLDRDAVIGDELLFKGKYAEAAEFYRQALARTPKNPTVLASLGIALGKQFKLDGADEQLDKALQIDPRNALAHSGRALVLLHRLQSSSGTIIKNRATILSQAEDEAKSAIAIDPNMPEAHFNLGSVYREEGRSDDAANEFKEAIRLDSKYSEALAQLGMIEIVQNKLDQASDHFRQAIAINTGNSTAHYGLGRVLLKQDQTDDAIKELNTALYQYPNSAPAHEALGAAYEKQGNTNAAIKEYHESIRIKPENLLAYMRIADIREQRGDLELSLAELRSALEAIPDLPDLHLRVADESLNLGKFNDAIKEYQATLRLAPTNDLAIEGLSRACYMKAQAKAQSAFFASNDYQQALTAIDQAIKLQPQDLQMQLAKAKLVALSGNAVDLGAVGTPRNDAERIALAEALIAQNKFQEAAEQMKTVIGDLNDAPQLFAIGDLSAMIHDLNSAEAAYKKAAAIRGQEDRAQRGLALVEEARQNAQEDLFVADELAHRNQLGSAMDKYKAALSNDPQSAQARLGLAKTLEKLFPDSADHLRSAVSQYKLYLSLDPSLQAKDREKLTKHVEMLEAKAGKLKPVAVKREEAGL